MAQNKLFKLITLKSNTRNRSTARTIPLIRLTVNAASYLRSIRSIFQRS
jgi:hypothetical protein